MRKLLSVIFLCLSEVSISAQEIIDDGFLILDSPNYVLGSSYWNKTHLKYYINNNSTHLTPLERENAIKTALKAWSDVTYFTFEQVSSASAADLKFKWATGNHGDGSPFDGPGKKLGHAAQPPSGEIHFDDAENWSANLVVAEDEYDLVKVAIHEIGHALGLKHSEATISQMNETYSRETDKLLYPDDCLAIWARYSCPFHISGSKSVCQNETYTIDGLPSYLRLYWDVVGSLTTLSSDNQSYVDVQKSSDGTADITAYLYRGDYFIKTFPFENIAVGTPSLSLFSYPVSASGNRGFWTAYNGGNTYVVEEAVDNGYNYYEVYLYDNSGQNMLWHSNYLHNGFGISYNLSSGWYLFKIKGYGNCGSSDWEEVYIQVKEANSISALSLEYNESEESVTIKLPESNGDLQNNQIKAKTNNVSDYIVQLWGNTNLIKSYKTSDQKYTMSLIGLKGGIYYIRVIKDGRTYSEKLVKK